MKPALEPVVWSPPPRDKPPGASAGKKIELSLRRLALPARGEDVAVDSRGRLIAGLEDGRVVRLDAQGGAVETLADTGGRPVGVEVDRDGSLVVCDARRGVLRIEPEQRTVTTLADAKKYDLRFCNNAAVARDGTIYFSDSSRRFTIDHWMADIYEHSGTGRLFKLSPGGRLELLLDGLQFANGVALAADESFVAVAETGAYRVVRHWLSGAQRGRTDLLVSGVPGFPDNLSTNRRGHIWIAIPTPRNPLLDFLHRRPPALRRLAWAVPSALQPRPTRIASAMSVDAEGRIVGYFAQKRATFHMVTGVREHGGMLYLASLQESAIAVGRLL